MKNEDRSIEELFQVLDETVEKLESRDISLEESFKLYEQGMELLRSCNDKIDTVEKKMLQMNENGELSEFLRRTGAAHQKNRRNHIPLSSQRGRLCKKSGRSYELQHGSRWKTAASDPDGRDISDVWRNIGYH